MSDNGMDARTASGSRLDQATADESRAPVIDELDMRVQPAVEPLSADAQTLPAADDQSNMDAQAAHQEYMHEAQQLIDKQTASLFAEVEQALAEASGGTAGTGQASVQRGDNAMTISAGGRSIELLVEAITDLPEGSDRAQAFTTGQARCSVRSSDGTTDEWILHRVGAGEASPAYTWMHARTDTPVGHDDIIAALRTLFQ